MLRSTDALISELRKDLFYAHNVHWGNLQLVTITNEAATQIWFKNTSYSQFSCVLN